MSYEIIDIPVIDAVNSRFDSGQVSDVVGQLLARETLGAQIQLEDPASAEAACISIKDREFLEFLQEVAIGSQPVFEGFNACNDRTATCQTQLGWHIDTLDDWMSDNVRDNSFAGLATQKTRAGTGDLYLQLGTTELLSPHFWLEGAMENKELDLPEDIQLPRFEHFVVGPQYVGQTVPGRWTLFSHGFKRFNQLPLWHYFGQPREVQRAVTCVFYDSANTTESLTYFSGLAAPAVRSLIEQCPARAAAGQIAA